MRFVLKQRLGGNIPCARGQPDEMHRVRLFMHMKIECRMFDLAVFMASAYINNYIMLYLRHILIEITIEGQYIMAVRCKYLPGCNCYPRRRFYLQRHPNSITLHTPVSIWPRPISDGQRLEMPSPYLRIISNPCTSAIFCLRKVLLKTKNKYVTCPPSCHTPSLNLFLLFVFHRLSTTTTIANDN